MKTLKPIREIPGYYERIEKRILELFLKEIYAPLLEEMPRDTIKNSMDSLIDAIKSGRIRFYRGKFKGRFNSTLSRELRNFGAEWDRTQGSWKIPQSKLPMSIREALSVSQSNFDSALKRIDKKLADMIPEKIAEKVKLERLFDQTLWRVDTDLNASAKGLELFPKLDAKSRAKIAEEYSTNMKLYIKDWTEKEIIRLRAKVEENAGAGVRYESLAKDIQSRYQVSQSKAKFLARQETSIMMSKFKEVRYKDAGIEKYRWVCAVGSENHPVRPWHKIHDGKIFSFDDPPQTDEEGNHKNPGMDYNCRCVAAPVLK